MKLLCETYLVLGADLDLQVEIYDRLLDLVVVSVLPSRAHLVASPAGIIGGCGVLSGSALSFA